MRFLLWVWFTPLVLFWTWYGLAVADTGYVFFSRQMHDAVFAIYGNMLGVDPSVVPAWLAKACVADSVLVLGIFAFVRRRRIAEWWRSRREPAPAQSATSLSSAP